MNEFSLDTDQLERHKEGPNFTLGDKQEQNDLNHKREMLRRSQNDALPKLKLNLNGLKKQHQNETFDGAIKVVDEDSFVYIQS